MSVYQDAADATLRIEHGSSRGSGFHFLAPDMVVTNYHVISNLQRGQAGVTGVREDGELLHLTLLDYSPTNEHDFAILRAQKGNAPPKNVLQPKLPNPIKRGTAVIFSGFPHGIPHLLVQAAVISGLVSDRVFYIDGSVNGGNSGGPILDPSDSRVIGVVTQRRFLGAQDLGELSKAAEQLRAHCQTVAARGSVQIMGIDFSGFSQMQAEAMLLIRKVLEANANAGIGIGFSIEFVAEKCRQLRIAGAA